MITDRLPATPPRLLPLSEVFGPTWQGEGPHTGRLCSFVRLGLCNLSCEWCDTPYTWDTTRYDLSVECPPVPIRTIHDALRETGTTLAVLSGGEPMLHHRNLRPLLTPEWEWHVETNGTIRPPDWWDSVVTHTTISPKVGTRDPEKRRIKPDALTGWAAAARRHRAVFKFVVTEVADLSVVDDLCARFGIEPESVWIMPEGIDPTTLVAHHRALADAILTRGYNTTTRLHVLLYGNERGH